MSRFNPHQILTLYFPMMPAIDCQVWSRWCRTRPEGSTFLLWNALPFLLPDFSCTVSQETSGPTVDGISIRRRIFLDDFTLALEPKLPHSFWNARRNEIRGSGVNKLLTLTFFSLDVITHTWRGLYVKSWSLDEKQSSVGFSLPMQCVGPSSANGSTLQPWGQWDRGHATMGMWWSIFIISWIYNHHGDTAVHVCWGEGVSREIWSQREEGLPCKQHWIKMEKGESEQNINTENMTPNKPFLP